MPLPPVLFEKNCKFCSVSTPKPKKQPRHALSSTAYIGLISGAVAGIGDTVINYPAYGFKYRIQRGESFKIRWLAPNYLYQGVGAYASGIVPATIIQDGVSTLMRTYFKDYGKCSWFQGTSAFLGGVAGALIATPIGNVIVTQQEKNAGPLNALKSIKQYGLKKLGRGMSLIMIRDGIYSAAAFWGVDMTTAYLNKTMQICQADPVKSTLIASVGTGLVAGAVTQPLDVIATLKQQRIDSLTARQCAKELIKNDGIKGLYKGFFARSYSISAGIWVLSTFSRYTKEFISDRTNKDLSTETDSRKRSNFTK